MLANLLIPNFEASEFAVPGLGFEVEEIQTEEKVLVLPDGKENLILRMMSSDVFLKGQMSLKDIARVSKVDLKIIKKIYMGIFS